MFEARGLRGKRNLTLQKVVLQLSVTADWPGREMERVRPVVFKWRQFEPAVIVASVNWCRQEWVTELRRRIVTHRRFKRLVDQWTGLSIGHSRPTMRIAEAKVA
jgi:hypothetical protein